MLVKFIAENGETLGVVTPTALRLTNSGSYGRIATTKIVADDGLAYQVTVNLTVLGSGKGASLETKTKYAQNVARAQAMLTAAPTPQSAQAAPQTATITRPNTVPQSVWDKLSDSDKLALVKAMTP